MPLLSASFTEYNRGFMPIEYVESGFMRLTMLNLYTRSFLVLDTLK